MATNKRDPKATQEKQAFIAKMVKSDANQSMYQIGEMVKEEFGSMIAFDKLREAFLAAGGTLGKRGRKMGSKNSPKAGKAAKTVKSAGKTSGNRRDPAVTLAKQAYVKEQVKADPSLSMFQIGEDVKTNFGSMLAFEKLREAFIGAGGKLGKRGRKPGSKNKSKAAKTAKAAAATDGKRANVRSAGRRKSDVAGYVARRALGRLSAHLVVVTDSDGTPVPYTFENKTGASDFVQKQLDAGVDLTKLGYYHRQEMGVKVTL